MRSVVPLRSPLLRTLADWRDSETPGILRRRRAVVAGIAAFAGAVVLLIRAGLVPVPALDIFYLLHDYAALPFWGYAWTFFAPYSITWWSLAAIALVVWLTTFLSRRSAVRGLHARLCRILVLHFVADSNRSARHVARLTAGVDWLAARTLGAELLKDVVRLEQTRALTAIVNAGPALDERAAWRLVRLTDLLTRLTSNAGAPARERWRSLAIWHQALMWIDHRAGASPRAPRPIAGQPGGAAALISALAATGRFLLDRLDDVDVAEGDALSIGLRRDGQRLFESSFDRSHMRSILERLDELWALVEHGSNEDTPALAAKAPDGVIEAQGILVSSIGLHAASRTGDVHLAASYLQAFEALRFVAYLDTAGREGGRVARALTAEAPERDHYRLAAEIAESACALRASAERAFGPRGGRAVIDEAASHERIRIDALHDAAAGARSARTDAPARDLVSRLQHRIRYRPLPLRTRVDPILLGGLAVATVVYGVVTALIVLLVGPGDMAGWSARALPDRRLLENVRLGLESRPFLDALFHAPDRQLVVSQAGGVFHSYDPDTALWSTERPFGPNDLARPDVRLLASSTDTTSDALWGVTADGGLVRRHNGRWEIIVGDTRFLGRRGTPVQQNELSAIAASADGKWLLAAAGAAGVGLQDLERRRWLSRDEISTADSPTEVTQAAWWRDRFYVGGPEGVSELAIGASRPLAFRRVKGLDGALVTLEATAEGLFVLENLPCENGPSACVRLSRMIDPFAPPTVLIDERNRYPELSLDRLFYAVQWKDNLILAGGSGIFDYDARLHSWKRQAAETISAVGPCAAASSSSSCFYYGYGGRASGVSLFTPETRTGEAPQRWSLAGEQPTRIASGTPGSAAVLTAAGRAYALAPGSVSTLINPATSSPVPLDRYRDAVTFGDKVLFFGQPGALLHDIVRRSYSPLPAVPAWLRSPASIITTSGAWLFGLEPRGASYDAYVAPQHQVELGTLFFNTAKPFPIDGPIRAMDRSSPGVLRVIDGRQRVQSIAASGVTALTGGRLTAMAGARLLDVAGTANVLAAATSGGVRLYSMRTRAWSDPLATPAGERAVEIAERHGTWFARSEASRLVTVGARPSVLIGGGERMPRRRPSDARQSGTEIYLAWPGTIQRYDVRARQITASWTFEAAGPVRLTGVIGAEPLSLAGSVARLGAREIPRSVHDMLRSGSTLWLTSGARHQQYLAASPLASLAPQTVADIGPLRLTRGADGTIEGALRVADVPGRLSWMPIDLSSGKFPFDVVRSIAVVANALYVGTDAGLQVYDGSDVTLERARLVTLTAQAPALSAVKGSGAPATVDRVGESCAAPGTAVACGPRGCAKQASAPAPSVVDRFVDAPADALSCRLRAHSPFWSWHVDASGLSGRYVVAPVRSTPASVPPVTLADGQLSHDDIGQVVSFRGNIFTVWQGRYVGVHPTELDLSGARTHAFDLPVRLVTVTNPVPMLRARDRDLAPGLYAIEGPRTWRYLKDGWEIVTDASETATIADCDAHPPLIQRQRLRLVRRAARTMPAFEMRMPQGAWTPLRWDAPAGRYAVDVWQDLAVHRQTLWIATPAGLVSRDGNWSFNPDTVRVLGVPTEEAGRTATDIRVDGRVAEVRYDGARTYRIAIDGPAPAPPVRLERDPFAEQAFDVDARYWAWHITGRTGSSAGRLAGTWKGEPIAIVNGRFDFDAINSMAVFQGLLHVATNTRGWFALPVDSAALERRSRPSGAPLPALDVAKLHANSDPDEPELCLQGVDGQFARLSPNGASRRTQGCPVFAARTGFWRYARDGSTLRVLPAAGAARAGERRLVDGRFTDEVITGAPVTGMKHGRSFTLVPTSAGVMWWNAAGQAADMHAPPFQGKPDAPRLLQWTAGGSPAYVADGTLYSLEGDDQPRGSWTVRLPPKAVFERLGNGPGPLLSIDWSQDGRRHHTVVDPRNSAVSHDEIPVDARRIPAYFQRAMTDPSHDGLIRLRLRDHVVSAYAASEGWPILEADDSFQLLAGVSRGTRAILVGPRHLIELNMERIARAVYSGAPPPPTPGSKKQ